MSYLINQKFKDSRSNCIERAQQLAHDVHQNAYATSTETAPDFDSDFFSKQIDHLCGSFDHFGGYVEGKLEALEQKTELMGSTDYSYEG